MDFTALLEVVAPFALLVVPPIALARFLAAGEAMPFARLFAIPLDPPLPRGVQEEEPLPWQLERLHPRRAARAQRPGVTVPALDARESPC